ncbi:MAG: hypothetical protein ACK4NR_10575 [Micavibrio sp.]
MFSILKSNKAYNRTIAHPADPAVRIALHEDDLAALRYKDKAKAVIFKRALPDDVRKELALFNDYSQIRLSSRMTSGPLITISPCGDSYQPNEYSSDFLKKSPAVMADMFRVTQIYCRAAGHHFLSLKYGAHITEWLVNINDPDARHEMMDNLAPHADGHIANGMRMTCAYAAKPEGMGTGWFPGPFDKNREMILGQEFKLNAHPEEILARHNNQKTDAGDLVFFRTGVNAADGSLDRFRALLHNSPVPPVNKIRLLLLLPA